MKALEKFGNCYFQHFRWDFLQAQCGQKRGCDCGLRTNPDTVVLGVRDVSCFTPCCPPTAAVWQLGNNTRAATGGNIQKLNRQQDTKDGEGGHDSSCCRVRRDNALGGVRRVHPARQGIRGVVEQVHQPQEPEGHFEEVGFRPHLPHPVFLQNNFRCPPMLGARRT